LRLILAAVLMMASLAFGQSAQILPVGASGSATYTGTPAATASFGRGTNRVAVFCTTACWVKVGESPTATNADVPLPANVVTILQVPPGTGAPWAVSAMQVSSGGSVFAQPSN